VNETTKDNESKGGEQHMRENTTYQWEHEQESETEYKRECVREKMTMWAREKCEEAARTRLKMREGGKKCKSKNSVTELKQEKPHWLEAPKLT